MLPAKCCTLFQFVRALVTVYLAARRLSFPRYWNNNNNNFHVCFVVCQPVCVCFRVCFFVVPNFVCPHTLTYNTQFFREAAIAVVEKEAVASIACSHLEAPFSAAPREFTYINQSHFALLHFMGRFFYHIDTAACKHIVICPFTPLTKGNKTRPDETSSSRAGAATHWKNLCSPGCLPTLGRAG